MSILGYATCELCGEDTKVKVSKKSHLYATCVGEDCGHQMFCRSDAADNRLARRIHKWTRSEDRKAWLGDAALPRKARPDPTAENDPLDAEPEPEAEPEAEPEPEADPEPEPRRPARRGAPPRRSAKGTPPGRAKNWWDLDL